MRSLCYSLLLAIGMCACSQAGLVASTAESEVRSLPLPGDLQNLPLVAEPRGIVGEVCSPAMAAKGVC